MKPRQAAPARRNSALRRQANDWSEAKLMAVMGQFVCLWLLLWFTDEVLKTEFTLVTLLSFVIIPDSVKKIITMRYGNGAAK